MSAVLVDPVATAKAATAGVLRVVIALVISALITLLAYQWHSYKADKLELAQLRIYKHSVESREEVRAAAIAAYLQSQAQRAAQVSDNGRTVVIHDQYTKEAANEDPDTADFLAGRIPQRLRDADARARRSGRLGTGGPRPVGDGEAR